jgi:hypothetical protein
MQLVARASRFLIGPVACFATHDGIPTVARARRQTKRERRLSTADAWFPADLTGGGCAPRGGRVRSDDGGRHWSFLRTLRTESLNPQISSLIVSTKGPDTVYAGVYRDGLFRSTDGGLHWARRSMGFRNELIVAMAVNSAHPPKALRGTSETTGTGSAPVSTICASPVSSFASDGSALHASTDGGGVFER